MRVERRSICPWDKTACPGFQGETEAIKALSHEANAQNGEGCQALVVDSTSASTEMNIASRHIIWSSLHSKEHVREEQESPEKVRQR
jgi:hypothetical protein